MRMRARLVCAHLVDGDEFGGGKNAEGLVGDEAEVGGDQKRARDQAPQPAPKQNPSNAHEPPTSTCAAQTRDSQERSETHAK